MGKIKLTSMIRYGLLKNNLQKVKSAMSLFQIQEWQSLCLCDVVNSRALLQLVTIKGFRFRVRENKKTVTLKRNRV